MSGDKEFQKCQVRNAEGAKSDRNGTQKSPFLNYIDVTRG